MIIRQASARQYLAISGSQTGKERSEEHTSELQSPCNLVCRLLLEKKKHDAVFGVCNIGRWDGVAAAEDPLPSAPDGARPVLRRRGTRSVAPRAAAGRSRSGGSSA